MEENIKEYENDGEMAYEGTLGAESEEKEMMDLLTKGKVALKQFVAYDDRDFKDFCKEEDLDYNDPNALQEYVETYDDVALIEMLNDD
jgi:ribosomal protein S18